MKYALRYDGVQVDITPHQRTVEAAGMMTAALMILNLIGYELMEVHDDDDD